MFVDQSTPTFFVYRGRGCRSDQDVVRFSIIRSVPEIFAIKVENCQKSRQILDDFLAVPNFWGLAFQKLYPFYHPCLAARRLKKVS